MATIKLKKSGTANSVPQSTDLQLGEVAINYADGKLYYKNTSGTVASIGGGASYSLPVATSSVLGGVKVGAGLSAAADGTLSATASSLPVATSSVLGGVKVGTGLSATADGTLSATAYSLPVATSSVLGGVKVGTNLTAAADGTLSTTGLVASSVSGITGASAITNIVQISQANYNAIASPSSSTLYIIVG